MFSVNSVVLHDFSNLEKAEEVKDKLFLKLKTLYFMGFHIMYSLLDNYQFY